MPYVHAYFPGSTTELRLKAIAKKLDGKLSRDFAGITVNGYRVLYRHAQYGTQTSKKGVGYEQLRWHYPFGRPDQLKRIDFVLLHASKPEDAYFLFPVAKARKFAAIFPKELNLAVNPIAERGERGKVRDMQLSLKAVKWALE